MRRGCERQPSEEMTEEKRVLKNGDQACLKM